MYKAWAHWNLFLIKCQLIMSECFLNGFLECLSILKHTKNKTYIYIKSRRVLVNKVVQWKYVPLKRYIFCTFTLRVICILILNTFPQDSATSCYIWKCYYFYWNLKYGFEGLSSMIHICKEKVWLLRWSLKLKSEAHPALHWHLVEHHKLHEWIHSVSFTSLQRKQNP